MEVEFGAIKHHQLVKEYTQGYSSIFDLFDESLLVALFFEYSDAKTILNVSYTCHTFHDLFHSKIIRKWFGFMGVTNFYIPRECRFLFLGHCRDAQANEMKFTRNIEGHAYGNDDENMQEINPQFFVAKSLRTLLNEPNNRQSNCTCWKEGMINTKDGQFCFENPWCCNNRLLETLLFDPDKDFDIQIKVPTPTPDVMNDPTKRIGVYIQQFWLAALAYVCRGGIKTIPQFISIGCNDIMSKFFLMAIARVQTVEMTTNHMEKFWMETKKELLLTKLKECRHQDKRDAIMNQLGSIEMTESDVDLVVLLRHLQILYSAEIGGEKEHKWLTFDMKKESLVGHDFVGEQPDRRSHLAEKKDSAYINASDMDREHITMKEIADEIWWSTKIMQMVTGKNAISNDPLQPKDQRFDQTVVLMMQCIKQLEPTIGNLGFGTPAFDILGKMEYDFDPEKEDYIDFFHRVFRPLFGRMLMRVTRKVSAMSTVKTHNPVYHGYTGNMDKPINVTARDAEQLRRCYVGTSSTWFPDEMLDYLLSQINTQVLGIKELAAQFTGDELKAKINAEVEAREGPLARYNHHYIPLLNRGCMDRIGGRKCLPRLIDFLMDVWEEFAIDLDRSVPLEYPAEIFCMAYVPKPHSLAIKYSHDSAVHDPINRYSTKMNASFAFLLASRKDFEINQHFSNRNFKIEIDVSMQPSEYGGFRHCNMYTMLEMKRFLETHSTDHFTERNFLFGLKNRTKNAKLIVDTNEGVSRHDLDNRGYLLFTEFSRAVTLSSGSIQSIEISVPSGYWNNGNFGTGHSFGMLQQLKELKLHGVPHMFDMWNMIDMASLPLTLEVLEVNCTDYKPADSLHDIDPWSLKDSFSGAALLNLLCPRLKRLVFIGTDLWSILNYTPKAAIIDEVIEGEPVGLMFKHLEYLELGYTNCQIHVGSFFSPLTQSLLGRHNDPDNFFTIFPTLKTLVLSDTVIMGLKQRVDMEGKPDILLGESLAMVMRMAIPNLNRLILCGTSLEASHGFRCSDGFYQRLIQIEKPVLEEVRFNISRYPYDLPQGFFKLYDTKALALYNQYRVGSDIEHEDDNKNSDQISFLEQLSGNIHLERLSFSEYNQHMIESGKTISITKWWEEDRNISFPNLTTYVHQGTFTIERKSQFQVALELAHLFPSLHTYKFKHIYNDQGSKLISIISRESIDPITREATPEIKVQTFPDTIEKEIGYGLIGSLHGDRWNRLWSLPRAGIQSNQGQLRAIDLDGDSSSSSSSSYPRYNLLLKLHDVWKSYQTYIRRFGHHCYHHCINVARYDVPNDELNTCQSVASIWDKGDNAWYAFNTFTTMFQYHVANEGWKNYLNYLEYLRSPSRWALGLGKRRPLLFLSPSPILTEPQAEQYFEPSTLKNNGTTVVVDENGQLCNWLEMASMGDPYWATPDTVEEEMEQPEETLEEMYENSEELLIEEPSILDRLNMDVSSDSDDDDE